MEGLVKARSGQAALVFGASSGIGLHVARALAREGVVVGLAARRAARIDEVARRIESDGGIALRLVTDVSDRDAVDAAVKNMVDHCGALDVLVNTAGVNVPGSERALCALNRASWMHLVDTDLTGALHTLQAGLAAMSPHGRGLIIQTSSISARFPDQTGAAYQATKRGVVGLCQAAMLEQRPRRVRISVLLPGLVATPMVTNRPSPRSASELDRALRPEDVANACVFLARLPKHVFIPELLMLPTGLQVLGETDLRERNISR